MQRRVAAGIDRHCKERLEDIAQHLPEALHLATLLVDAVQTGDLNQPADVLVGQTVHVKPTRQT